MAIYKYTSATALAIAFFFLGTVLSISAYAQEKTSHIPIPGTVLDDLMAAYNGENNAHVRYLAFANRADEEGYGQVAGLFRAAARAEQVHYERYAAIIKELGVIPKAAMVLPIVKSTKENLGAAVNGENYESDVMYPEFIAQAKKENVKSAADAFEEAKAAEEVHAQLYQKALNDLAAWKGAKKEFFVCPTCGNVVEAITGPDCPICGTDTKKFMV